MVRHGLVLAFGASVVLAATATAQRAPTAGSPMVDALDRCRTITEAAARLACFDRTAADLVTAARSGDVSMVDRAQMRQARRSLFGFSTPKLPFFTDNRPGDDPPDELHSTVKSARALGYGKFRVQIADGDAFWETTEDNGAINAPKVGQKLDIRRGALGSFTLRFAGERWVRAKRVG